MFEKTKIYWIFDPRIDETHKIKNRNTQEAYQRANIRYFFSWEGLSKFLLAPVFKVGLASTVITPIIASVYTSFGGMLETYLGITIPIQMVLLFFSGLFVVIARTIYEIYCPKLLKSFIKINPLDEKKLQNQQWVQMELEYCLLQYVYGLPKSKGYLRRKESLNKVSKKDIEESNQEEGHYAPVLELAPQRVGFDSYGIWLIENLLLRISKRIGRKLFVSSGSKENDFTERKFKFLAEWIHSYPALFHVDFRLADEKSDGSYSKGDLLVKLHETSHHMMDDFPENAFIHRYFNGLCFIEGLEVNDVVIEFIAEIQNYGQPLKRILITFFLLLSIVLLLLFLIIQTSIVVNAIF